MPREKTKGSLVLLKLCIATSFPGDPFQMRSTSSHTTSLPHWEAAVGSILVTVPLNTRADPFATVRTSSVTHSANAGPGRANSAMSTKPVAITARVYREDGAICASKYSREVKAWHG